jgi:hypothetical protein
MPDPAPEYWFPAKRVGLGWGLPLCWQGWLTLAVYVATLVGAGLLFQQGRHAPLHFFIVGVATALLLLVCFIKGEPLGRRDRF